MSTPDLDLDAMMPRSYVAIPAEDGGTATMATGGVYISPDGSIDGADHLVGQHLLPPLPSALRFRRKHAHIDRASYCVGHRIPVGSHTGGGRSHQVSGVCAYRGGRDHSPGRSHRHPNSHFLIVEVVA